DAQEFLRCLMDLLHEELKEPVVELEDAQPMSVEENMEEDKSQSDLSFQPCESCGNCDKTENDTIFKPVLEDPAETTMLIQDDDNNSKISSNRLKRANSMEDLEKDTNTASETTEFLNNQGTVKVQIHSRFS
ncbi:UBP33 hydrolase, partial [Mystacornis crossleyi]|nr:UBP33 hydrolase [Mystacornis crossleyi]